MATPCRLLCRCWVCAIPTSATPFSFECNKWSRIRSVRHCTTGRHLKIISRNYDVRQQYSQRTHWIMLGVVFLKTVLPKSFFVKLIFAAIVPSDVFLDTPPLPFSSKQQPIRHPEATSLPLIHAAYNRGKHFSSSTLLKYGTVKMICVIHIPACYVRLPLC